MEVKIVKRDSKEFAECNPLEVIVSKEQDALDIMSNCGAARSILLYHDNFIPGFFDLSTGLAGAFMQKFVNYSMRLAVVVDIERIKSQRFKELILESKRGNAIRFFETREAAEEWLLK